jgi:hypothetical protein
VSKTLVVFNICGINGRNNTDRYLANLASIYAQSGDFDVAVSACMNTPSDRKCILQHIPDLVAYNDIRDKLPVNVTFNHTCLALPNYDNYIYVDSGISFEQENIIADMILRSEQRPELGMVSCNTTTDSGLHSWFPEGLPGEVQFVMPPGKCHNLHVQLFKRCINNYYGRILPDVFASHCTESVLSFVVAAIKKNWLVLVDRVATHDVSMDGASAGFNPNTENRGNATWNHTFASKRTISEIVWDERAAKYGLGFEEGHKVLLHDASQFDENLHCVNTDLKEYIRDNLYLQECDFNYSNINHRLYS